MIEQEYKILLDYEQYYKLIKMLPFSEKRIQKNYYLLRYDMIPLK